MADDSLPIQEELFRVLQKPGISKTEIIRMPEDNVIKDTDAKDLACPLEALGAFPVLPAWGWIPRGMIVQKYKSRAAIAHRRGIDLARMNY